MSNSRGTTRNDYSLDLVNVEEYEEDLEPYLALFLKPLTNRKSQFSKNELEVMCKDPLHSPKLILYLIDFVKEM